MTDTPSVNGGANERVVAVADAKKFTDRVMRLMEQRDELLEEAKGFTADISDVLKEAKGAGYDVKALREVVRIKRMTEEKRQAVGLYAEALGAFE